MNSCNMVQHSKNGSRCLWNALWHSELTNTMCMSQFLVGWYMLLDTQKKNSISPKRNNIIRYQPTRWRWIQVASVQDMSRLGHPTFVHHCSLLMVSFCTRFCAQWDACYCDGCGCIHTSTTHSKKCDRAKRLCGHDQSVTGHDVEVGERMCDRFLPHCIFNKLPVYVIYRRYSPAFTYNSTWWWTTPSYQSYGIVASLPLLAFLHTITKMISRPVFMPRLRAQRWKK